MSSQGVGPIYNIKSVMFRKLRVNGKSQIKQNRYSYLANKTTRRQNRQPNTGTSYTGLYKQRKTSETTLQCFRTDTFIFQGFCKGKIKTGEGILFFNSGLMVIGTWSHDVLEGKALIWTPFGAKIYAYFRFGKLYQWALVTFVDKIVMCIPYYENQISGEKIVFESTQNLWVSSQYSHDNKLQEIKHMEAGTRTSLPSFIRSHLLQQLFEQQMNQNESYLKFQHATRVQISPNITYYGFLNESNVPDGLGVIESEKEFFSGWYCNGSINKYGRIFYANGDIYHGEFNSGTIEGTGIYYSPINNTSMIAKIDKTEKDLIDEFDGYIMINFSHDIGTYCREFQTGVKGQAIDHISQTVEKYYYRFFVEKQVNLNHSLQSNFAESEHAVKVEPKAELKIDGRSSEDSKLEPPRMDSPLSPRKIDSKGSRGSRVSTKWIKLKESVVEEEEEIGQFQRSASLDKRDLQIIRKSSVQQVPKAQTFNTNAYESIPIQENTDFTQNQKFKKHTPQNKRIELKHSETVGLNAKSVGFENITFRNRVQLQTPEAPKVRKMSEISHIQQAEKFQKSINSSVASNISEKVDQLLTKNKKKKRTIFNE